MQPIGKIAGSLLNSRTIAHILHLKAKSYSVHMALQGYYEDVVELIDDLVEVYQSKHGIIMEYDIEKIEIPEFHVSDIIKFFTNLNDSISENRKSLSDNNAINTIIDDIQVLIGKTIYKLKYLN